MAGSESWLGPAVERGPVCALSPKQPLPAAALGRRQLPSHSSAPTAQIRSRNAEKWRKAKDWKREPGGVTARGGHIRELLDFEELTVFS